MDKLRKSYNNFPKMKLNDFLIASISAAISQYFTSLGIKDQTYFTTSIPINMKPQPRTIEDVRFGNDWSACLANVPLSTDIEKVMKVNRKNFDKGQTMGAITFGALVLSSVGLLPDGVARL